MKKTLLLLLLLSVITLGNTQNLVTGTIVSKSGNYVSVQVEDTRLGLTKGDSVSISKDISGDKNPFGITISSGWMSIGDATYTKTNGTNLVFHVYKETANIKINGEKKEQFVKWKKVKVEWD